MAFPIIGGSQSGGYLIDNSLRFNDDDSAYLYKDFGSAGNRRTWTWSGWIKRGNLGTTTTGDQSIFDARESGNNNPSFGMSFDGNAGGGASNDAIDILMYTSGIDYRLITTQVFRDVSAWYHIVFAVDTTQATASNRLKLYVNGSQITAFDTATYPSLNFEGSVNNNKRHGIGSLAYGGNYQDGYMTEVNFIDGQQLTPTDFGEFDEDSGIWKPIEYTGTYGTNGFYLDFENSGSLGADQSGNGNNFTPTNLASTDQTTDTPTNNFCTLNPLDNDSDTTFSEGNTKFVTDSTERRPFYSTYGLTTGKWYWEVKGTVNTAVGYLMIGIAGSNNTATEPLGNNLYDYSYRPDSGNIFNNGSSSSYGNTFTDNDIIGIALDLDNNKLYFSKNGTFQNSGDPTSGATGTGAVSITDPSSTDKGCYIPSASDFWTAGSITGFFNFGNPAFSISSGNSDGNGYGNFEYAPPTGFLALCTQNLATELSPTIDDGSAYFQTLTYAGNSSARTLTNDGHSDLQPDWIWIKSRTGAQWHHLFDSSRGGDYRLHSNSTNAESTLTNSRITSFNTDGFSTTDGENVNITGNNYVAWQWKANAGSTSSNTDGSITSTVQANTTAGFSIVTYTGNGTAGATIGHGLGVVPNLMIVKMRTDAALNWEVYHSEVSSTPQNDFLLLNQSSAKQTASNRWNNTAPTSSVFTVGNGGGVNTSGKNYVAYLFNNVEGYSKFGSYTGNGSTDGAFVYTGFKPAWVMMKRSDSTGNWSMYDNKRPTYNVLNKFVLANSSNAEETRDSLDFLSNGFKLRNSDLNGGTNINLSGATYIYMAFAENPFVTSGTTPVTAR